MSFLKTVNYQPMVDMLDRLGNQLNKPSYRFLKGEVIGLSLEKVTSGRLHYVDEEGYDSIDTVTGVRYELKSTFSMFSAKNDTITGRVSLSNTNKSSLSKTFDFLLCIQTDPENFAIAQLSWDECNANHKIKDGQVDLLKGTPITNWICKDRTKFNNLPMSKIEVRKLLESIL
jgi:hypothetical protein